MGGWGAGGSPQTGRQRLHQHWKQPDGVHWCHVYLYISHKAAKSISKLISQWSGELQLAVCCQGKMEPFEDHPSTCGCLTSLRNKPQKKLARETFSTNTWLNCYLMCTAMIWLWKVCLAVVSVEGGFSQIWSHILMNEYSNILCALIFQLHD